MKFMENQRKMNVPLRKWGTFMIKRKLDRNKRVIFKKNSIRYGGK